MAALVNL